MLVAIIDNRIYVRLSRRNLRQVEAMLDSPAPGIRCLARKDEKGVPVVLPEDDADHYEERGLGPGLGMWPEPAVAGADPSPAMCI